MQRDPHDTAHWCVNDQCGSKPVEVLKLFVSKNAIDIDGIGPVICEQLLASNLINNPGDLFSLSPQQLASLDRMGARSAERMFANIQAARERPLERVLYALGVYRLGRHVSAQLAGHCSRWTN